MGGPADFDRLGDLLGEEYGLSPTAAGDVSRESDAKSDLGRTPRSGVSPRAPVPSSTPPEPARMLAVIWSEVVGEEVAANAHPLQLRGGRLVVSASSSAWAQTLQLMSEAIAARINERLGDEVVTRVVFRHAGWEERRAGVTAGPPAIGDSSDPARTAEAGALSAEQKSVLAGVGELDLSPELREKIERAIEAAFARAQQDSVR